MSNRGLERLTELPGPVRAMGPRAGPDPLPVLFLIPTLERGGAEGQLIALINVLDRRRFDPILCCLDAVSPDRRGEIRCEVVSLGVGSLFRPAAIRGLLRIAALIRCHRVRVAHALFLRAEVLAVLAGLLDGRVKVILGKRDLEHFRYKWHERFLARLANWGCDAIVANAAAVKSRLESAWDMRREKTMVIHNGIDLEQFVPASTERRVEIKEQLGVGAGGCLVAMVTHLVPVKGVEALVDAAAIVVREAPDARFAVVGGGDLRSALEERARSLGIEKEISFVGSVRDVRPYLEAADMGVLSSLSEGFPNAILEYMAMGIPVVATGVGGVPELLGEDGECGFLVPAGAPAALAARLLALVRDPELRARMGKRGRLRAERLFDSRRMVGEYERLYDRLASQGGGA